MTISFNELKKELKRILLKLSFAEKKAEMCADIFASNSRDGVYSHGLNRFPVFVEQVKKGLIDPAAEPECVERNGLIEIWDGRFGPGIYNATICMDRAIALAKESSMSCRMYRYLFYKCNCRFAAMGWKGCEAGQ